MGGSGTNVLVAPWGDPSGWREVSYKYKGRETIKSITSLIPILCNEDVGKVIILVQDSVIFTQPKRTGVNDIARECGGPLIKGCGDDKSEAVWKDIAEVKGYRDVVDTAKGYIWCIVKETMEKVRRACGKELKEPSIDVVVVPSIGTFSIKCGGLDQAVRFNGTFDLMYSVALLGLHEALIGLSDVGRVIFDATHGVNYFTIMSMMASQDVLSILAFRNAWNRRNMPRLTVYNAIPESPDNYLITKISTQLPSIRQLDSNKLPYPIRVFYNALIHNAPLALYYLKKELEKPSVGSYEDFINKVRTKQDSNTLTIDYNLREQIEKDRNKTYIKLLFNEVTKNVNEPSYEELQRLAKSLYKMVSRASQTIIINELNNIYNRIKKNSQYTSTTRIRLSDILGAPTEATGSTEKISKKVELRHLTAHAGLLKDHTIVNIIIEKENNEIKTIIFEYDNWDHIKALLNKHLKPNKQKAHETKHSTR